MHVKINNNSNDVVNFVQNQIFSEKVFQFVNFSPASFVYYNDW